MKKTNKPANQMGFAMLCARQQCHLQPDEVALLLRITPAELFEYERGTEHMPTDVLQHVFIMGYKMMRIRVLEDRYRRQRRMFQKIKTAVTEA